MIKKTFEGEEIEIRQNGEPWLKAADMSGILGISNTSQALSRLADDEKRKFETEIRAGRGGTRKMNVWYVNEPGCYRLAFESRSSKAADFKRWLAHDVLPEIRRTGEYRDGIRAEDTLPRKATGYYEDFEIRHFVTEEEIYTLVSDVFRAAQFGTRRLMHLEEGRYFTVKGASVEKDENAYLNGKHGGRIWVDEVGLNEWLFRSSAKGSTEFITSYLPTMRAIRAEREEALAPEMHNGQPIPDKNVPNVQGLSYRPSFWSWSDEEIRHEIRSLVNGNLNNYGRIYQRMRVRYGIDVGEDLPDGKDSYLKAMNPFQLRVAMHVADTLLT